MRFCCRAERQTPALRHACGNAFCQRQPANGRVCLIEFWRRNAGSKASAQYYAGDCLSFLLERALLFCSDERLGNRPPLFVFNYWHWDRLCVDGERR